MLDIYEHMNFDAINIEEIREQLQNPKYYQVHRFTYDYVFNEKSNQQEVYEVAAKQAIDSTLKVRLLGAINLPLGLQLYHSGLRANWYRENFYDGGKQRREFEGNHSEIDF